MRLRRLSHQDGGFLTDRAVLAAAASTFVGLHWRELLILTEHLETLPPTEDVWCHTTLHGLVLDATDDDADEFARIAWVNDRYQIEMFWPLRERPTNQDLIWAGANARLVGMTADIHEAGQLVQEVVAHAPRVAPATQLQALGLQAASLDVTMPYPTRLNGQIRHKLAAIRDAYTMLLADPLGSRVAKSQLMLAWLDQFTQTTLVDKLWISRAEDGRIDLYVEHISEAWVSIMPEFGGYTVRCGWLPHPWARTHAWVQVHASDRTTVTQLIAAAYTYR